jgi:hypothetical protein
VPAQGSCAEVWIAGVKVIVSASIDSRNVFENCVAEGDGIMMAVRLAVLHSNFSLSPLFGMIATWRVVTR